MLGKLLYSLIDSSNNFIVNRYRAVLAVFLMLTIPMVYFYLQQRHENHIGIYFDKDNEDLAYYREFQNKYGNEEFVMIAFKEPDIFTAKSMDIVRDITGVLKNIDGVQRVLSLTSVKEARGEGDTILFRKIIGDEYSDESLAAVKKRVLADRNLVNGVISSDGTTAAIVVQLKPFKDEEKRKLVRNIMSAVERAAAGRTELHMAGVPVVEARMNMLSARDFRVFTPVILLVIFVIVAMSLRNWMLSLLTQLNMILILVWGIGM
ncbi:MAG TPA: MMPL family transporter, partial [Spirochaetota bacterium]|nr:MMPL family transporter [Spirochaetota bacterium]